MIVLLCPVDLRGFLYFQNMAEDGNGKPKWPYTSVEYLNRAGAARKKREEARAASPWIGLTPVEEEPEVRELSEAGAVGGQEGNQTLPLVAGDDQRHCPSANKVQRREEPMSGPPMDVPMQNVPMNPVDNSNLESVGVYPGQLVSNIPHMAALMAQVPAGNNFPVVLPDISSPPPGHINHSSAHEMHAQMNMHPHPMMTSSPAYPMLQSMLTGMHGQNVLGTHPPDIDTCHTPRGYGQGEEFAMRAPNIPTMPQHVNTHEGTQTGSGIRPMFVKAHGGPAGMPDARVQCPRCADDRWYIDVVTPRNPYYQDLHVIDSRMRCLSCHGDVWQVDLLTSTEKPRGQYESTGIHSVDRMMSPRQVSPAAGRGVATPRMGGLGRVTPESGYNSGASTPGSARWSNTATHQQAQRAYRVQELANRRRVIRRLLYGLEEEGWTNEEL